MPSFAYTLLEKGERRSGRVQALDAAAAAAQLKQRGGRILRLTPAAANASSATLSLPTGLEKSLRGILVRPAQIERLLDQLAQMLRAGVPLLTALQASAKLAPRMLKHTLNAIAGHVREGRPLHQVLQQEAAFIGPITLGLIRAGENNGALDEMLRYAAGLLAQRRKVRSQILGALAYPLFVMLAAFGLGYYMVTRVIPQIMDFIGAQSTADLPRITQYLVYTNDFMQIHGRAFLLAAAVTVAAAILAKRNRKTAPQVDEVILYIPPIGAALKHYANALWCRTLGSLVKSGIDIMVALELAADTVGNAAYQLKIMRMRDAICQGVAFPLAMRQAGLDKLCPMAGTMIGVSEHSGGLDEGLLHAAAFSEEQLARRVALLSKMIEPAIFILVGGMVGFVYFAFFLAVLSATQAARGGMR